MCHVLLKFPKNQKINFLKQIYTWNKLQNNYDKIQQTLMKTMSHLKVLSRLCNEIMTIHQGYLATGLTKFETIDLYFTSHDI